MQTSIENNYETEDFSNILATDAAYYESISGGFDDSIQYEFVPIGTKPHAPIKATTPQNQAIYRLDAFDICTRASAEISAISDNFGIDGQALINILNRGQSEYKNDTKTAINSDKSYKGKSKVWLDIKTARNGQEYPVLTFHSLKHGGISEQFNGYKFLLDSGLVNAKPLSDNEKQAYRAKQAEREQQQAKRAELIAKKQAFENRVQLNKRHESLTRF